MKGIIIAAGAGRRMGDLTKSRPKCLLEVAGRSLLDHTIASLRGVGCQDIVVITGYMAEAIPAGSFARVHNRDFARNNILHSLMYARDHLTGPVMVSYSDIWVEPRIHALLASTPGDIVLAVDRDWLPYYEGRAEHPIAEAENVYFRADATVAQIGKHLDQHPPESLRCGEFLGLWRMSAGGTKVFREAFEQIDSTLGPDDPFEMAKHWRQAYITDLVQHLVDSGLSVGCALVERGWAELDTASDYARLNSIARRQRLDTVADFQK